MKLAEALVLRADIQKRISQIRSRLEKCVLVQEGEKPAEQPSDLLAQLDQLFIQLERLIVQINKTNLQAHLASGQSLTDALAQRDVLTLRYAAISQLADTATPENNRYSRTEIRSVSTVDVAALRQQQDQLAQQRRELDTAIQALNWTTNLIES